MHANRYVPHDHPFSRSSLLCQFLAVFKIENPAGGGCYMLVGGKFDVVLWLIIQIMIAGLRALKNLVCEGCYMLVWREV